MVNALILRKLSLLESNKISDFTKIFILCNYKVDKIKQQLCYRRPPTLSRRLQTKISYTLFAIMYIPSIVCTVYNLLKPVLVLHALHCKHTQPTSKNSSYSYITPGPNRDQKFYRGSQIGIWRGRGSIFLVSVRSFRDSVKCMKQIQHEK